MLVLNSIDSSCPFIELSLCALPSTGKNGYYQRSCWIWDAKIVTARLVPAATFSSFYSSKVIWMSRAIKFK